jgi:dTDP-4-amino-4,6-dideoxygalactose transaminase
MSDILALAREHGLRILEDAAHAIGAEYRGTKVGKVGDLTAFSFYPNKNITTGEGGAVCTERAEWAEFIQIGRLHGLSRDAWKRYSSRRLVTSEVVFPGYKYNLTDLQAALGIHQLAKIERFAEIRRRLVQRYDESLRGEDPLSLPARIEGIRHAEHLYPVLLRLEQLTIDRNAVVEAMLAENVGVGIHYVAVHLHPYYQEHLGFRRGDFPNAEWVSDRVFSLPISPGMTESDVDDVVFALRRILRYYRR